MENRNYIVVTSSENCVRWLNEFGDDLGNLMYIDTLDIERIAQLADASDISAILVHLQSQDTRSRAPANESSTKGLRQELSLIEGLVASSPGMPVLALAERADEDLLLAVMRAGARDFIKIGTRGSEVTANIKRHTLRGMSVSMAKEEAAGKITAIISARPGTDAPILASHLAIAMQRQVPTLLLDLGIPHADTMMIMGLSAKYTCIDTIRNLRRLDETLIETGFGKHKSGLTVLSMPEEPTMDAQFTSADIYMMLRTMRRFFPQIIINLGGVPRIDFLMLLLSGADNTVILAEQSVPSCKKNFELIQALRESKLKMQNVGLVVDRYLPSLLPDAESIAQSFGVQLFGVLPPSGMARLATMNSGISMFEQSPKDPYLQNVIKLSNDLIDGQSGNSATPPGLLSRFMSKLRTN